MTGQIRPKVLTEHVTIRVTPEEKKGIEEGAEERGLSESEYGRALLLSALETSPDTRLLLAELMELRFISLTLLTEEFHSTERAAQLRDEAAAKKYAMAEKRILAFKKRNDAAGSGREQ